MARTPAPPPGRLSLLASLLANLVGPYLGYELLRARGWSEFDALLGITLVPLAWGLGVLLWQRRWDPLAVISAVSMALNLLVCVASQDTRSLQVRDSYLTLAFGVVLIGSVLISRPALYALAVYQANQDTQAVLRGHFAHPRGRRFFTTLTLVWGIVFVFEFAIKLWMIEVFPIETVLAAGPWVLNGVLIVAAVWSFLYARSHKRSFPRPQPPPGDD